MNLLEIVETKPFQLVISVGERLELIKDFKRKYLQAVFDRRLAGNSLTQEVHYASMARMYQIEYNEAKYWFMKAL